ncbi:NYN domain-containing protein [Miltoncostaea oceani]|uniref:NYN domain-containing protein n=1 Tax=Miltoncostaea oceani TaxID=2843216 RepID=UPI001C3DFB68|nr:NYN domain-containing protein [Miltoncostaea oceani]
MAEHESSLAVLVDFENMARPGAKGRADFDIHLVLNRLAEKGRVIVKRAYADWSRYRDARHELMNAGLGLIEMPSAREGAKNRADIQMAVDAMELAYSREHVNTFVIVSGDSDFTPLVGKLRELNKRVIGVGNRESASELLIANCDEFIFYDRLAAEAAGGSTARRSQGSGLNLNPVQLLQETLTALQREGVEWPLASIVKDSMRRKYPAFDESEHGFSTFSKFLEEAGGTGMVRLETDPRSGTYRVELGTTTLAPPPAMAAAAVATPSADRASERTGEDGEVRRRRRRGGRGRSEASVGAPATPATEGLAPDAEVFEVVVTPTPDLDLGTLPPLDEPISYEDMIMLGPEVEEDIPELVEATDVAEGAAPARSTRRRRRRGAGTDPEPTVEDLEPIAPEEPAEAAPEAAPEAPVAAETEEADARRRRRRRATPEPDAAVPAPDEAPVEPVATLGDESSTPPSGDALTAAAPADEEAPAPAGRRRVRRRAGAAEPVAEAAVAEPAAEEEAPKPKRRTRKTAEAEVAAEAPVADAVATEPVAEEAPAPKRRTRKKAEPAATTEEAPAATDDAAPAAPKRRTRKKAEPAATTEEAPAATDDAAPAAPKRRTRKKAEPTTA